MAEYKNKECPVCAEKFADTDDIVVCPECGAPYHRECYNSLGCCKYKDMHGTEDVARLPHNCDRAEGEYNKTAGEKQCPRCLSMNGENAAFCNSCGFVFVDDKDKTQTSNTAFKNEFSMIFDPMGGVDPSEFLDGVPGGDIAKFIRNNTFYYLPIFKKIKEKGRSKFNFSAFLFSGVWFLYRKQYKIGVALSFLNFSMMLFSSAINFKVIEISGEPLLVLAFFLNLINMMVMIFSGIFANKIYFHHCVKTIKDIKSKKKQAYEYTEEILAKGGVNVRVIPLLVVCYIIIEYLPSLIS